MSKYVFSTDDKNMHQRIILYYARKFDCDPSSVREIWGPDLLHI